MPSILYITLFTDDIIRVAYQYAQNDFGKNIRDIPQTIYLDYYFYSIHGMATLMLKLLKTSFNNKIKTWNVKKSKVKET